MQVRKDGTCPWLRPDGKTQVTVEYFNDKGAMVPQRVQTQSLDDEKASCPDHASRAGPQGRHLPVAQAQVTGCFGAPAGTNTEIRS